MASASRDPSHRPDSSPKPVSSKILRNFAHVATHFGVRPGTVHEWIAEGMPCQRGRRGGIAGHYDLDEIAAWLAARPGQQLIERGAALEPEPPLEPTLLAAFLRRSYATKELLVAPAAELDQHTTAVAMLGAFLGRPANDDDASEEQLLAFATWAQAGGFADTAVARYREILATLAAAAKKAGPLEELPSGGGLNHFFENVYRAVRLQGGSASTVRHYRGLFNHFAAMLGRPAELSDLNDDAVSALSTWLVTARGVTAVTANKYVEKLSAVWRYANRRGVVTTWPDLKKHREPKRVPKAWTVREMGALLDSCRRQTGQVCGVPADQWWFAFVLTQYYTGTRIGATLKLRFADLDFEAGSVLFRAETQKHFSDQFFVLPPDLIDALHQIRTPERALVFPWARSPELVFTDYGRILEKAGLPNDRHSKFHKLRRTSASHLKAAGGDPTQHLGHSGPRITKVYLDPEVAGDESQACMLPSLREADPAPSPRPTSSKNKVAGGDATSNFLDWV